MLKTEKETIVAELTEKLEATDTLIVADYRGLTNKDLKALRARLREHGAQFSVVKNTLTRRAAEQAGADALLALLEGPSAIAFVESGGDPAAVAKALADTAKETKILTIRGGILSGRSLTGEDIEELAKVPPIDVVKGQLLGVIVAPMTQLLGLLQAPVQDLVGLIDARIEQLGGDEPVAEAVVEETAPEEAPAEEPAAEEPAAEAAVEETAAETAEETCGERPTAEETAAETAEETRRDEAASPKRGRRTRLWRRRTRRRSPTSRPQTRPTRTIRTRRSRTDGYRHREGARDARQDDRARAGGVEEGDRGGVGRDRRCSDGGRGCCCPDR